MRSSYQVLVTSERKPFMAAVVGAGGAPETKEAEGAETPPFLISDDELVSRLTDEHIAE